jgi:DNA-binding SARP family transcriptional activator/tetratricopeptide (TPR) repeat protein
MLHLRLFGSPTVTLTDPEADDTVVSFDTRKAVALLAYLAVTGRPQSRDVLAALLWPELEQSRARGALRRTLSVATSVGDALVVAPKTIAIDQSACVCDVVQFRDAAASADVATWRTASDLASDRFLAGFSLRDSPAFDDWQAMVGDELADQLSSLLGRLVADATTTGDLEAGLGFARRRVQIDPLSEPAHVDLMRVLAESGDRSGALRQYRALVRVLDRELGVPPLPETIVLQEEIRSGRLVAVPPIATSADAADHQRSLDEVGTERRQVSCVGRQAHRAQLLDAWRAASSRGVVGGVVGDPGMGRTTLMSAFAADVADASNGSSPLLIALRPVASEQGLAYAAAGDLVRALLHADPDLATRLGEAGESLTTLSPIVGPSTGIESSAARRRVHEAVLVALASTPAIVVVDDAHLVDAPSAELLGFVARRCPSGVLFVATWPTRVGDAVLVDAVRETAGGARPLVLGALTAADVRDLAGADERIDADDVIDRTGGVPLLVAELVAERAASGDAADAVAAVVAARLDAAPATTQQVVGASVVLGTVADPELLRATCGRDEYETVEAIEDAVQRGLLVERRELGGYDVPHALVRQASMAQLGLARRRLLHGRAADTLARRHGVSPMATPAGVVAGHLERAGREDEAASWYWLAAQESLQLFAHAEAVEQLRTALALGYDASEVQPALGAALTRLGRYGEALLAFEQAAALVDGQAGHLAELELQIAEVHDRLGEWDLALDRIVDAQQLVDGESDLAARLETQAALMEYRLGRVDDAEKRARAASELAESAADPVAGARAANMLGVIAGARGSNDAALVELQSAVDLARSDGDRDLLIAGLNNLARALARVDRDDDAVLAVQEAVSLAATEGDLHHEAVLRSHLADLYHALGRVSESQEQQRASASALASVDSAETRPEIWTLVEW